jgi:hypothetical protein
VNNAEFELKTFDSIDRLKPNCCEVAAYWLPCTNGDVNEVYLYQDDNYIGKAVSRNITDYNENQIEQTDEDETKKLHQNKRISQFDKKIKDRKVKIPKSGRILAKQSAQIAAVPVEILETIQPAGYDDNEFTENADFSALGKNIL